MASCGYCHRDASIGALACSVSVASGDLHSSLQAELVIEVLDQSQEHKHA